MVPRLENSYKTKPGETEAFNVCAVERAIHGVLSTHLAEVRYDQDTAARLAMKLASLIKADVKKLCMPRYKIVTQVRLFFSVADSEICPGGAKDSRNLRPHTVTIFFLTSFSRARGARASRAPSGSATVFTSLITFPAAL